MEIFEKAFDWLASLSSKLPEIPFKAYFVVVLAVLLAVGVVFAFCYLGSRASKLTRASKRIQKYLDAVDVVNDDNVGDFTEQCFSQRAPQPLRDSWVQYLGVRYGYPSDIVSDKNVYDKVVKKNKDYRSGIYLVVSLILLGAFAFWGYGMLDTISMSVIHFLGLVLIAVVYLALILIHRKQTKRCLEVFDNMQEDLDAKVNLQFEKNYATDSSPLLDLVGMVDEIIARNVSKEVEIEEENAIEPTPIETLIELEEQSLSVLEEVPAKPIDDVDNADMGASDDIVEDVQDQEESVVEEETDDTVDVQEVAEETAGVQENVQEETQADVNQEGQENEDVVEEILVDNEDVPSVEESDDEDIEYTEETTVDDNEFSEEELLVEDEEIDDEPLFTEDLAEEVVEDIVEEDTQEQSIQEDVSQDVEDIADDTIESVVADEQNDVDDVSEIVEDIDDTVQDDAIDDSQAEENEEIVDETNDFAIEEEMDETPIEDLEDVDNSEESVCAAEEEETVEDESDEQVQEGEEPEVVYVVDGEEDDDEDVKPAKLVKLPNLVDYMLTKDMPKSMKIQIATMLISTYKKFENSKEDRKIVVSCLTKVMRNLQQN